jgi:hypothetical protein
MEGVMRGKRILLLVALLCALLPLTGYLQPAVSQPTVKLPCADRAQMVSLLRKQFGERLTGYGLSDLGVVFEIYAAADGGWSLIVTRADGTSCLIASGSHWQAVKPPAIET